MFYIVSKGCFFSISRIISTFSISYKILRNEPSLKSNDSIFYNKETYKYVLIEDVLVRILLSTLHIYLNCNWFLSDFGYMT